MDDIYASQLFSPGTLEAIDMLHDEEINNILDTISFDMDDVLQPMASKDTAPSTSALQPPPHGGPGAPAPDLVVLDSTQDTSDEPAEPPRTRAELAKRARDLQELSATRASRCAAAQPKDCVKAPPGS